MGSGLRGGDRRRARGERREVQPSSRLLPWAGGVAGAGLGEWERLIGGEAPQDLKCTSKLGDTLTSGT